MEQYLFLGNMMALDYKGVGFFFYCSKNIYDDIYPLKILSAQYSIVNYSTKLYGVSSEFIHLV